MSLPLRPWSEVEATLPPRGRHLLAAFDARTVTVFAAHDRAIGAYAVAEQRFGGPAWADDRTTRFRLSLPRVMARSERGERAGKQAILGMTIRREHFDRLLRQAIHWREFPDGVFATRSQWRLAVRYAQVVVDWAPDCGPDGADLDRLTPRFGIHAPLLRTFATEWIVRIHDLSALAAQWRSDPDPPTPVVAPYSLPEPALADRLLWAP